MNSDTPSKALLHCWRLLIARLRIRDELHKHGVIDGQHYKACVLCFHEEETCHHLCSTYRFAKSIWTAVFEWLGMSTFATEVGVEHFNMCYKTLSKNIPKRRRGLIWIATAWTLRIMRNQILFKEDVADFNLCIYNIKLVSWTWFLGKCCRNSCWTFSNWYTNPLIC